MDDWVKAQLRVPVAGIPVEDWIAFFRLHTEGQDEATIRARLDAMAARLAATRDPTVKDRALDLVDELLGLLET